MVTSPELTKIHQQIAELTEMLHLQGELLKHNAETQSQLQADNLALKERYVQLQQSYEQLQEQINFLLDFIMSLSHVRTN